MRLALALIGAATALACTETVGPPVGFTYRLSRVNGGPIPFAEPGTGRDSVTPVYFEEGWVRILNGSFAERHERLKQTILTNTGDSVPLVAEWTYVGRYRELPGSLVITYEFWSPWQIGPMQGVDTLTLQVNRLTLREGPFLPPFDSLVRVYCLAPFRC
jgi:hypothetical protein